MTFYIVLIFMVFIAPGSSFANNIPNCDLEMSCHKETISINESYEVVTNTEREIETSVTTTNITSGSSTQLVEFSSVLAYNYQYNIMGHNYGFVMHSNGTCTIDTSYPLRFNIDDTSATLMGGTSYRITDTEECGNLRGLYGYGYGYRYNNSGSGSFNYMNSYYLYITTTWYNENTVTQLYHENITETVVNTYYRNILEDRWICEYNIPNPAPVPEPSTMILFGTGIAILCKSYKSKKDI